jgi:hypothetical protein
VNRLRSSTETPGFSSEAYHLCWEAADEIEAQQAEIERLRTELRLRVEIERLRVQNDLLVMDWNNTLTQLGEALAQLEEARRG